ncbi:MAG TPA: SIMPL domain-containing protein [Methanotrichaceae archaeon]|nr:SIMPL domain-containing protein [Methanotrichaceae archaeon]
MRIFEALLLGMLVLLASTSSCLGADDEDCDEISMLTISGTGDATDDADMVTVVLGVQTRNESAAGAVADNARMMADSIEALKMAGVPEKEIKTSMFSIYSTRDWIDGKQSDKVIFEVSNQVTFTLNLTDEVDVGEVLDAAVGAGTNSVDSITFGLKDPTSVQEKALEDAVADAMGKAEVISEAAGVTLGRILSISEGGASPVPIAESRVFFAADVATTTPIMPGDVKVTATVTITYEIKN